MGATVSTRTIARVFFTVVALTLLVYLLYLVRQVVGLVAIAVFLAVSLGPAVDLLERVRVPRGAAILVVFLALFGLIFLVGLLIVPPLVDQVRGLADDIPRYIQDARENKTIREFDDKYDISEKLRDQADTLPSRLGDAAGALRAVTVGVFTALVQLITVLTITFFLLKDGGRAVAWGLRQLPRERARRYREIAESVYRSTAGYVAGALSIATICGVSTFIALTALGVPFSAPLAVLMAFMALIPLVGATIGGVAVGVVTLFNDFPADTIIWAVFLIVYQQVENNVLQPQIYKRTVDLHPLLVIVAVLVGANLLGVLGALVAIPVAAALQIFLRDWWRAYRSHTIPAEPEPEPGAI